MAIGAATMFALQPMIGKLLAPSLGSVPAVWATCMLFFQVVLLAAYTYVHWLTKRMEMMGQMLLHGCMVAVALTTLPLSLPQFMIRLIPEDGFHALWIFTTLSIAAGAGAFILASTAPLIQAWFGSTTHRLASNPYPLYIASNAGSLVGLISYPLLIEPNLSLTMQRRLWSITWVVYALMLLIVAIICLRNRKAASVEAVGPMEMDSCEAPSREAPWIGRLSRNVQWIALSFVPSSLLLGVTSHIATDIAAMPLLWIIPLALYLLSWTFSFTDWAVGMHRSIGRVAPFAVLIAVLLWGANFHEQILWILAAQWIALLTICWALHRQLYEARPETLQLTSFYIAIALGGALGGIFNVLVAPLIFSGFAEYPLALVAALFLLPGFGGFTPEIDSKRRAFTIWQHFVLLVLVVICTAALSRLAYLSLRYSLWNTNSIATRLGWTTEQVEKWAEFGIPLIPALLLFGRPRMQAIATCTALLVGVYINLSSDILVRERSFFGVMTVREFRNDGVVHSLVHGGIMHGEQRFTKLSDLDEPRSYYHKDGPLGDVMDILKQSKDAYHTAAIGLGTGSIAAYSEPNRPITFFEIDPKVEAIARNPKYFTYVNDALQRGCPLEVRIGDARITMAKSTDSFDLMVIDAFSSDSIPLHLLTREAIEGWFRRLQTDGVIAFHISNRYIDLAPVLANAAEAMGIFVFQREDLQGDAYQGRSGSNWVIFTADPETAERFRLRADWTKVTTRPGLPVWTDDFASVLPVFRF